MPKAPITVTLTWGEAANLLVAAGRSDTTGWTRAAKGNLERGMLKLASAIPMDDNAIFLVVKGQTVARVVRGAPLTADSRESVGNAKGEL